MSDPWNFKERLAFRRREQFDVRFVEGALIDADGKLVCEIGPIEESALHRLLAAVNAHAELLAAAEALLRGVSEEGRLGPWLARLGAAVARVKSEAPPA